MSNLRDQTMNRLNNVSFCIPGAPMPAPIMPLSIFEEMLYKVVYENGYSKTKETFLEDFIDALSKKHNITEGVILDGGNSSTI